MRAGPREVRTACVTGVDITDADRKLHRTLPGDANTQDGPAGAATAVPQLGMALLQPICAKNARREPNSAIWSRSGLPRGIRNTTMVSVPTRQPGKSTIQSAGGSMGKEDCCWKQNSRLSTEAKLGY